MYGSYVLYVDRKGASPSETKVKFRSIKNHVDVLASDIVTNFKATSKRLWALGGSLLLCLVVVGLNRGGYDQRTFMRTLNPSELLQNRPQALVAVQDSGMMVCLAPDP